MQPYFFPYLGYFQLINSVDEFIIYDNIEFTKKGWINRNRILVNNKDSLISLPLEKDSDYLCICDRYLAVTWEVERIKMLNRIKESYRKAPFFKETYFVLEKCIMFEERNLFKFNFNSIYCLLQYLNINTKLTVSSSVSINHQLRSEEKVIAICKAKGAKTYINPIGGLEIYDQECFMKNNLKLQFQKSNYIKYAQFNNEFIPWLSIIDVLMFNSANQVQVMLDDYELI